MQMEGPMLPKLYFNPSNLQIGLEPNQRDLSKV